MGNPRCQWVRDRLPLLAGDDLRGLDRRRVERHLIGCSQCRQQRAALRQALETLRAAAATSPTQPDTPSLWPALARQIHEARRPIPAPGLSLSLPCDLMRPWTWAWLRINPWPAVAAGVGLALLVTLGLSLGVPQRMTAAQDPIPAPPQSIARVSVPPSLPPAPTVATQPHREPPAPVEASVVDSSSAPRLVDYDDIEPGRPMPERPEREARDPKATYSY